MALQFNPFTGTFDVTTKGDTGNVSAAGDGTAAAPGITFASDTNTGIYRPGEDQLALSTNGTGTLYIDASGRIGNGVSSPASLSTVYRSTINGDGSTIVGGLSLRNNGTETLTIGNITAANNTDIEIWNPRNGYLRFAANNAERLRITATGQLSHIGAGNSGSPAVSFSGSAPSNSLVIDSSGRLLVGTSSARANFYNSSASPQVQFEGIGFSNAAISSIATGSLSYDSGSLILGKGRGAAIGANTVVQNNDILGYISFQGNDGTEFVESGSIKIEVDGTPGANDMPGRVVLSTTLDGASSSTERLRITNDGVIGYNQPAPVAVDTTATLTVANLKTGIITSSTAAAVTMTLPTGTLTEGGFAANSLYSNFTFEWTVINTGATNAVTVQGGTGHTLVGSGIVAAGVSGRFASRRTAANTFVTYRLS